MLKTLQNAKACGTINVGVTPTSALHKQERRPTGGEHNAQRIDVPPP